MLFSSSLSFRAQLGIPLLQEALLDTSSLCWPLPFLTPLPCSAGQVGVEEGHAWASVAEGWGLDMLCHSSSETLGKLLDFSGTPSPLCEMMYFSFIHVSGTHAFYGDGN